MKTLTVFKASAGSGKTFTLAVEYIKLLIENPESFRGTLAVTFTNKATEEMKMRILSQLYALSKSLPESEPYMKVLLGGSNDPAKRAHISQQAGKALHLLLHNYHFFRVQTIDTFFQSILRNLARELQLNANLRVELNNNQVVEEAIDNLIDSIADDAPLRSVVMGYIRERISNNESWNFIRGIKDFGGNIFKDFYKEHRKSINEKATDPDFFHKYKLSLHTIMQQLEKKYHDIGCEVLQTVADHGLDIKEDFNYGYSGVMSYFCKMANDQFYSIDISASRLSAGKDNPDTWIKKTSQNSEVVAELVKKHLHPLMNNIEVQRPLDVRQYLSAKKTLEHINNVWLLKYVEEFAKRLNDASQRFMLSDTPTLLSEMVRDDDSPFVFEKIGAHLEHIMIDEFQDTSTVQWQNFKKLIQECMSKGKSNLIVGDVKQSIYRWRSGDWRLLNGIEQQLNSSEIDFRPLNVNYRSDSNVVFFNNIFFKHIASLEAKDIYTDNEKMGEELNKAYADVIQELPPSKPRRGFVHLELLSKNDKTAMEERTLYFINSLLEKGARLSDIAILLRSNKDVATLATYLEANNIRVVSAEAFRLDASTSVRIIIGIMKMMAHPKDTLTQRVLKKDLATHDPRLLEEFDKLISEHRPMLQMLSPLDMAEEIVRLLSLGTTEGAYITTFFDKLHLFCQDTSTILDDFLEAWDNDLSHKTIDTPECNGVRMMTIHKSKGLEFSHVIIPYCNWKLEQRQVIWCQPKEPPFNDFPVVPLNYTSVNAFKNTIYYDDILHEHIQNMVDNLNLLYVAFTRARTSLFVIGTRDAAATQRSHKIQEAIMRMPNEIEGEPLHISISENKEDAIEINYGIFDVYTNDDEDSNHTDSKQLNPFAPNIQPLTVNVTSQKSQAIFRQSNKSREFATDSLDNNDRSRYIRIGTVLHQIFSEIATLDDVLPVLQRMEFDGALYGEGFTRETLLSELRSKFNNEQVKDWFSDRWTLYNECTIINSGGKEQRPDRVMTNGKETIVVDFKFGKINNKYNQQVQDYVTLLQHMGMPNVKGFLWYVSLNKIESV